MEQPSVNYAKCEMPDSKGTYGMIPLIEHSGKGKSIGTDIKAMVARGKGRVWN